MFEPRRGGELIQPGRAARSGQQRRLDADPARREQFRRAGSPFQPMATHPTFGVEEEFLLVDADSGEPLPLNRAVAEHAKALGVDLQLELTSCQVETTSDVMSSSEALRAELSRLRRTASEAADAAGARL